MAASADDIKRWITSAQNDGHRYVFTVRDGFNDEEFPIYVGDDTAELSRKVSQFDKTHTIVTSIIDTKTGKIVRTKPETSG